MNSLEAFCQPLALNMEGCLTVWASAALDQPLCFDRCIQPLQPAVLLMAGRERCCIRPLHSQSAAPPTAPPAAPREAWPAPETPRRRWLSLARAQTHTNTHTHTRARCRQPRLAPACLRAPLTRTPGHACPGSSPCSHPASPPLPSAPSHTRAHTRTRRRHCCTHAWNACMMRSNARALRHCGSREGGRGEGGPRRIAQQPLGCSKQCAAKQRALRGTASHTVRMCFASCYIGILQTNSLHAARRSYRSARGAGSTPVCSQVRFPRGRGRVKGFEVEPRRFILS